MLQRGAEKTWLIGDQFVSRLSNTFISIKNELYVPTQFETRLMANADQGGPNAVGRILNNLTRCLNTSRDSIPKWVVIIPDVDIMKSISYTDFGVSGAYGLLIEYMMKEINTTITRYLGNNLPVKANRYDRPHVLWIEPTLHINYDNNPLRMKFIRSLHIASQAQERMIVLPLRQH